MSMIRLENVSKYYKSEETVSVGMKKINLEFNLGEFVAVTGESGSGKSTLLNVISGLDGYEDGELYLFGEETSHYTIADWEKYRGTYIGFVFQNYNIIDSYTVYQNVLLALEIQGYDQKTRKARALELIEKVGLTSHKNHKASKLSGGQKQRAVIARALAKDCPIIVADEPTGNLDSASGAQVIKLLHEISKDKLIVVVTHDYDQVAEFATRKIKMHDGEVVEDKKIKQAEEIKLNEIPKPKNMNFLTLLRFSIRNLLSTPKKTIFLLLMLILVSGIFTIIYTNQISNYREAGLGYQQTYQNVPKTRLLVEKRNGTAFTADELAYINNLPYVKYVYENHYRFFNDVEIYLASSNNYSYAYPDGTDTAKMLSANDVDGRLPVEKDEIVLSSSWSNVAVGDTMNLYLGYGFGENGTILGTFEVVGIDKLNRNILYFSDAYLDDADDEVVIDYNLYQQIYQNVANNLQVSYGGDLYYMYSGYYAMEDDIAFEGSGTLTKMVDQSVTIFTVNRNYNTISKVFTGVDLSVFSSLYGYAQASSDFYRNVVNEFMLDFEDDYTLDEPQNMVSISVDGFYGGNQVIKNINSNIYKVYYPSNINSELSDFYKFIIGVQVFVLLTISGLFLYTIVHAVTKNVMNTRKKDFAIYRSIGANKTLLARLVVFEQVILSVIGFIVMILIMNLISSNVTFIRSTLQYMRVIDYISLVGVFMIFGAWLGLRFNRKVFKQSVIETLSASKGE